jgi:hypothetical protein
LPDNTADGHHLYHANLTMQATTTFILHGGKRRNSTDGNLTFTLSATKTRPVVFNRIVFPESEPPESRAQLQQKQSA